MPTVDELRKDVDALAGKLNTVLNGADEVQDGLARIRGHLDAFSQAPGGGVSLEAVRELLLAFRTDMENALKSQEQRIYSHVQNVVDAAEDRLRVAIDAIDGPVVEPGPIGGEPDPVDPKPDPGTPPPVTTGFKAMINVAGAEFNSNPTGTINKDYVYASNSHLDQTLALAPFAGIRLPFKWTRLQRELNGPLNTADLNELKRIVAHVTSKGKIVMLDSHDYGRRGGTPGGIIGESEITSAHYADYWGKLADVFKGNDLVWYNSNEPHDQDNAKWWATTQMCVDAIRKAGAKGKIVFPGGNWTGAHSFVKTDAGSNSKTFEAKPVTDPLKNFAIDVHQYFDGNSSGTSSQVTAGAANRVDSFIAWAEKVGVDFFLGEWAFPDNADGHREAEAMLRKLTASKRCVGAAYWAGGPWWPSDWNIVAPGKGNGQLATLKKFM